MGAQKNCLNETILLSTHNILFGKETRKFILNYELLSRVRLDKIGSLVSLYPTDSFYRYLDKEESVIKIDFLTAQPKHTLWVFKRMRLHETVLFSTQYI